MKSRFNVWSLPRLIDFGLRDYGTAQWDGGDPECEHKLRQDPRIESSTLGGGKGTTGHQREGYSRECARCGARRVDRQIGLEPTLAEYIATLVAVFREVRRVLRDDGTVWLNLGDSYASGPMAASELAGKRSGKTLNGRYGYADNVMASQRRAPVPDGLKPKDLMMVPARVAIALQDDGWWLRSDIIWAKKNCMPESVQGSQYVRHRVTISDYERLSGLRYEGERNGQAWAVNLSDVQACEIPGSEAPVSAGREGKGDGAGSGRTRGRAGETPAVQSFSAGQEEQSEVRGYAEGQGGASQGDNSIPSERQGENQRRGILPANQERSTADSSSGAGKCEIRQVRGYESQEAARLRETPASDCAGSSSNSDGLVGDRATAQASLPLLRGTNDANSGSRDTSQQRRAARQREPRASVPELQFSEEQQTDSTLLVDCPGCPKCEANDGYILRWNAGRPTSSHEHIFLLTKSARYYYDAEAVREAYAPATFERINQATFNQQQGGPKDDQNGNRSPRRALVNLKGRMQPEQIEDRPDAYNPNGRNQRNVWHLATEPFSGWTETSRQVDVAWDEANDDTMRTPSPDCPIHVWTGHADPIRVGDERAADGSSRIPGSNGRHALELQGDSAATETSHDADSQRGSWDWQARQYVSTATDRSSETSRTGRVPATTQPYTPSGETPAHTGDTLALHESGEFHPDMPESNTSLDATDAHSLGRTRIDTADRPSCTCSYHKTVTESISHFATFPTEIPRRCIKAGTSEKGQCPACGAPWVRVVERKQYGSWHDHSDDLATGQRQESNQFKGNGFSDYEPPKTTGWQPSCTCDAGEPVPQTVLDPFLGSGTTLLVADQLGRHGAGIELNPEYAQMAERRIRGDAPMFASVAAD